MFFRSELANFNYSYLLCWFLMLGTVGAIYYLYRRLTKLKAPQRRQRQSRRQILQILPPDQHRNTRDFDYAPKGFRRPPPRRG